MSNVNLFDEDKKMLREFGVDAVVLFGSRATGTANDTSDYDFGILLNATGRKRRGENYHEFYSAVYDVFAERFGDLNGLDVVFLDRAPLELRRHVALYGRILMESKLGQVADFNVQTILLFADFEPYRKMFNEAVLKNI